MNSYLTIAWQWLTKGVVIDPGIALCALVVFAVLWFATRSTGKIEYPGAPVTNEHTVLR